MLHHSIASLINLLSKFLPLHFLPYFHYQTYQAGYQKNFFRESSRPYLQVEFLKHGIESFIGPLANLVNQIICLGFYDSWTEHIIHPSHKEGDPHEPNNYITIIIEHVFTKLYITTLDVLLYHKLEEVHRAKLVFSKITKL